MSFSIEGKSLCLAKLSGGRFLRGKPGRFVSLMRHISASEALQNEIHKFVATKGGNAPSYKFEVRASHGDIASLNMFCI